MKKPGRPITVVRPSLPDYAEVEPLFREIWESGQITNAGPLHNRLEDALGEHLGCPPAVLFNNGTSALVAALQALDLRGEVITTPYSFIATGQALLACNLTPVFVDIDPGTGNLDPAGIEAAITDQTSAILGVHCYGIPCDDEAIRKVAGQHGLKVVYDAAHAFAVTEAGKSILTYGDVSAVSLHATKVFNTFEGGAAFSTDPALRAILGQVRNFGIESEDRVERPGLNGKMSELNAAVGLVQLNHVESLIARRRQVHIRYSEILEPVRGARVIAPNRLHGHNFAYFPLVLDEASPQSRDRLLDALLAEDILSRRYFSPLLPDFGVFRGRSRTVGSLDKAQQLANQVLCLPMHAELTDEQVDHVCDVLRRLLWA